MRNIDVCLTVHHCYYDVSNQQDATTFSFISLFITLLKSALRVSGDKFAPILRSTFLTVYTAFGTMHRHCCRLAAVYTVKNVLLRMGANLSSETCRADFKRVIKKLINEKVVASCWLLTSLLREKH